MLIFTFQYIMWNKVDSEKELRRILSSEWKAPMPRSAYSFSFCSTLQNFSFNNLLIHLHIKQLLSTYYWYSQELAQMQIVPAFVGLTS